MNDDHRPDPDALLAAIRRDESRSKRGRLKVFLGMAAGVGKTYAMLQAAHERKAEGIDVVVGYVETHKRAETEALLAGLEIVPRQTLDYRGTALDEMNLDAVLARQPAVVLVDELAHTNVPGARHVKRYQDVVELLEAGIDVYTTVNVQHFESRADTVRQITGAAVQERLPDSVLDLADEVELIDLSPQDLRKRLAEGKVYTPDKANAAAQNFFRVGNLTALREMALRLTAERVDHQLQDYMQVKRISGPWRSAERLMVAVGPSPYAESLIRWTRRMAYNLEAPWLAAYIKTSAALSPQAEKQLAANLTLVRSLGGEVVTTAGDDITEALVHLARQRNVTQMVVGKTQHPWLRNLVRGGSPTERLVRAAGDIDVAVVSGDPAEPRPASTRAAIPIPHRHSTWRQYGLAVLVVAVVTILDLLALPWLGYVAVGLTELFAVLLVAVYIGRGPALLAAFVSALSWNFLFIEPRLTFEISRTQDILLLMLYFLIALFAGNLTARLKQQERQARYNSERSLALYHLAHDAARAVDMDDVVRVAVGQIGQAFDAEVGVWLAVGGGRLSRDAHLGSTLTLDDSEYPVALWAFDHSRPTGRDTDTLPLSRGRFYPLRTTGATVGVLGIHLRQDEGLSFEQSLLLETFVAQIALAVERELLDQAAERAAMVAESERLYTTLLNSISHELRTPITAIAGIASTLAASDSALQDDARRALGADIQEAAARLNRLVENLLDMSRLDSGRLEIKRDWCDPCDLLGSAAGRLKQRLNNRPLTITCAPDMPLISADFVLMEQVLVNLIDNACAYTPPEAAIRLAAGVEGNNVIFSVEDDGAGIPQEELTRIFNKFYRIAGTAAGGTGLGLSIAEGIISAHGGTIEAMNAPNAGARFVIRLPLTGKAPQVKESEL